MGRRPHSVRTELPARTSDAPYQRCEVFGLDLGEQFFESTVNCGTATLTTLPPGPEGLAFQELGSAAEHGLRSAFPEPG